VTKATDEGPLDWLLRFGEQQPQHRDWLAKGLALAFSQLDVDGLGREVLLAAGAFGNEDVARDFAQRFVSADTDDIGERRRWLDLRLHFGGVPQPAAVLDRVESWGLAPELAHIALRILALQAAERFKRFVDTQLQQTIAPVFATH